jgi:hypothetical protein
VRLNRSVWWPAGAPCEATLDRPCALSLSAFRATGGQSRELTYARGLGLEAERSAPLTPTAAAAAQNAVTPGLAVGGRGSRLIDGRGLAGGQVAGLADHQLSPSERGGDTGDRPGSALSPNTIRRHLRSIRPTLSAASRGVPGRELGLL